MPLDGVGAYLFEAPALDTAALAEAQLRISALSSELDRAKEREGDVRRELKARQSANANTAARLAELEHERDEARRQLAEARARRERESETQRRAIDDAAARARDAEERLRKAEQQAEGDADLRGRDRQRQEATLSAAQQRAKEAEAAL